jgi:hypothetical protein
VFRVVQVPEHGGPVLSAGGTEGPVGGDGHCVDVPSVAEVVCAELAFGQFPDLDRVSLYG